MQPVYGRPEADALLACPRANGLAGWILGRLLRSKGTRAHVSQLELIETLSLGGRRQLMLVRVEGESFLVGANADGIQTVIGVRGNNTESSESLERRER